MYLQFYNYSIEARLEVDEELKLKSPRQNSFKNKIRVITSNGDWIVIDANKTFDYRKKRAENF